MPRGRRKKDGQSPAEVNTLLTALKFVALAQRKIGAIEQTHCRLKYQWAFASNGIISAAHPIQDALEVCPNTLSLIDAMEQSPAAANLTVLEPTKLSVRAQDFQVIVPAVEDTALPQVNPDPPVAICDDRLKAALTKTGMFAVDGAPKLLNAAVQLCPGYALASDGIVILQAWHGLEAPPSSFVPKALVTALGKVTMPIARLGAGDGTLTIWYENGAWIKCQLYPQPGPGEVPDFLAFLNLPSTPVAVPKQLFEAAKRLKTFAGDGMIRFDEKGASVISGNGEPGTIFASESLKGIPPGISFNIESLLSIAPFAQTIHFLAGERITLFFGENCRGAIATDIQEK